MHPKLETTVLQLGNEVFFDFIHGGDTKRVCAVPFLAANVEVDVSLDGLVARYRCADEVTHRLVGRRFGVCKGNGWFPAPPTCEPGDCIHFSSRVVSQEKFRSDRGSPQVPYLPGSQASISTPRATGPRAKSGQRKLSIIIQHANESKKI